MTGPVTDMPSASELPDFDHHRATVEGLRGLYRELHAGCPVAHSPHYGGFYMLCGYDDVKKAAASWQDFSSAGGVALPKFAFKVAAIEFDPPEHTFWRDLYREVINLTTYREFQEHVEAHIRTLIDGFASRGSADLMAELADPLPVMTICEIIGIDDPERARVAREIALELFSAQLDPSRLTVALERYNAFCLEEVNARREHPRNDYLTRLATGEADGKPLTDETISNLLVGFLVAGHHTTSSAMSNLLLRVASDPTLRQVLDEDRTLIPRAVEETIRIDTPLHGFFRQTTREVEVRGVPIPAGSEVLLNYAAANRDPRTFENPESFDLDRPRNPHLGFGHGIHTCVGAQLARLELRLVLGQILDQFPDLTLRDEPITTILSGGNLHRIDTVPVKFTPTA